MDADAAARGPASHLAVRVAALGIAQIVSWGTLFYAIAVLGAAMRAALHVGDALLFGAYSAGLLVSGAASPAVGRWIDAGRARLALGLGSSLGAVALTLLAMAQGPATLIAGFLVSGVAMALTLYDPAFATLHVMSGALYRRAVTALTLFGGFASTVFWPLALVLEQAFGWRAALAVFAFLHLAVCLPLHVAAIPRGTPRDVDRAAAPPPAPEAADAAARATFAWLAAALAAAAFIAAALSAHVIGLLTAAGLTAGEAVLAGSLIGPMQVAGRIVEFTAGRRLRAQTVGILAFALMASALLLLALAHGLSAAAFAFAAVYGVSNGVMTIVRGTVPAELFGRRGFGALLGRLALPQLVARAVAPVTLALCFPFDPERTITPWLLVALGVLAVVAYRLALQRHRARTPRGGEEGASRGVRDAPEEGEVSR
ncbi:MAG TPA: MFS transporter [Casimicrobiaceae bacterium]|nr:MFS transporter [Casimicrobiaceae bacterium]